jgi:hypothetical protein
MKNLRPNSKFELSRTNKFSTRSLHQALPWLSYGSLKSLLGPQSFFPNNATILLRVVSRQTADD